jgi:hypothetical protein
MGPENDATRWDPGLKPLWNHHCPDKLHHLAYSSGFGMPENCLKLATAMNERCSRGYPLHRLPHALATAISNTSSQDLSRVYRHI